MRKKTIALLTFILSAALLHAECGAAHKFTVYVQKISHRDKVKVPNSGCRTGEGPCKASGTVFIVSTKKVQYTIFLVDGATGNLQVGESYLVFLTCGSQPMMIAPEGPEKGAFYILEQEAVTQPGA